MEDAPEHRRKVNSVCRPGRKVFAAHGPSFCSWKVFLTNLLSLSMRYFRGEESGGESRRQDGMSFIFLDYYIFHTLCAFTRKGGKSDARHGTCIQQESKFRVLAFPIPFFTNKKSLRNSSQNSGRNWAVTSDLLPLIELLNSRSCAVKDKKYCIHSWSCLLTFPLSKIAYLRHCQHVICLCSFYVLGQVP